MDISKYFFTRKVVKRWSRLPGGGVPIPGRTEKMCRCGAEGHGLGMDLAVLRLQLGPTVFSNINDSMIL